MKKILIIEDEIKLREELKTFLENNGYQVHLIIEFNNLINNILNSNCDLILLDINLPDNDGQFICKELRKMITTPIIMVTSKNTELDEILSINYGADDFIIKPYNPQVLLARINRLLNRYENKENIINYKDIKLDISKSIIIKQNTIIDLTKNELKILYYLLNNIGKIISREELMDYLWDNNEFVDDNTLTVNINRLRTKLEEIELKDVIITKRKQGYIIL
ncbi:MAG: response regulator transcription factor [Bacilli bacterium]|nr:response regulator transcription factor [Bacilli bacterium]